MWHGRLVVALVAAISLLGTSVASGQAAAPQRAWDVEFHAGGLRRFFSFQSCRLDLLFYQRFDQRSYSGGDKSRVVVALNGFGNTCTNVMDKAPHKMAGKTARPMPISNVEWVCSRLMTGCAPWRTA